MISRPRSWRRPPQQLIAQVEEPKSLRKWGFLDSLCHSEWPKVADAVIKADFYITPPLLTEEEPR
jgi:hypothetical protein